MRARRRAPRRALLRRLAVAASAAVVVAPGPVGTAASSAPVRGTSCPAFPADSWWHARVDALPVHARSSQWLAHMSPTRRLHPDFGPSYGEQSVPYGIPVTVVTGGHPKVPVTFDYDDESDPGPYPLGDDTLVEGGWDSDGDRHTVVVDASTCTLYETWATSRSGTGGATVWSAGSGAVWSLTSNTLRPAGWTSADAAGLPILPGLLRLDEVQAGHVDHAVRFTTNITDRSYLWPARHHAGSVNDPSYPPMGARFRLRATYPLTGLRADTQAVLRAMQEYGLVLADNGSPWYVQGEAVDGWPEALLDELKDVPATAFEAVDTSGLQADPDSMSVLGGHRWGWVPGHPPSPRRTTGAAPGGAAPASVRPISP